jgi:PAS domain S-box-containing protein
LQESEQQFRLMAESLPQLVWTAGPDGSYRYFNRRWHEFTGLPPEELVEVIASVIHPEDLERTRGAWRKALSTGKPYEVEYRLRGADGRYRWFLGRAMPMRDETGQILRWFGTCTDIDGQKSAEQALRRVEEQRRLALEAAGLGTWDYGLRSGMITWDARACALFGLRPGEPRSARYADTFSGIHPDDRDRVRERVEAALDPSSDGRYEAEYRILTKDGGTRWVHARGQTTFVDDGPQRHAVRLAGVIGDVTERRAAEDSRQLLVRELNHRVKNLFAMASGMVSMTARSARSTKDMAEALRGRLGALSRAHELLRPGFGPEVPEASETTLPGLISAILEPHAAGASGRKRLVIDGPAVPLGHKAVTSLALALHELATNAAKYGCLSRPEGRLSVTWRLEADHICLEWQESGGPAVTAAPDREGFGSQLARRTITGQLGGTLVQDWRPEGLQMQMALPLDRLSE